MDIQKAVMKIGQIIDVHAGLVREAETVEEKAVATVDALRYAKRDLIALMEEVFADQAFELAKQHSIDTEDTEVAA